jgi:glycerophosphoryl diester phosphodiesterase
MYPEETTEGLRASFHAGYKAMELDVLALSDGTLVVMHDSTVDRTTTGTGAVSSFNATTWRALAIDANTVHGSNFGDALTPPFLTDVLSAYRGKALLVLEVKATGVKQSLIDALVAANMPRSQVLVCSFTVADLAPAVAAGYPACFLASTSTNLAAAQAAGITWACLDQNASDSVFQDFLTAGFKVMAYTVNRRYRRDQLLALGVMGFITDDAQYLSGSSPIRTTDAYAAGTWSPGMLSKMPDDDESKISAVHRGRFTGSYWGWSAPDAGSPTAFDSVMQGWACPIKGNPAADSFTIDFKARFNSVASADQTRWGSVFVADDSMGDRIYSNGAAADNGYNFLFRKNGEVTIYTLTAGVGAQLGLSATSAIADGGEATYRITVTPTHVTLARLDVAGAVTFANTAFRGGYFHFCRGGAGVEFRDVTVS